jgi:hypothetical protein
MYTAIEHHSSNDKNLVYHVYSNDVMFELNAIEINGTFYDIDKMSERRRLFFYYYMVSRINVWLKIRENSAAAYGAFFI